MAKNKAAAALAAKRWASTTPEEKAAQMAKMNRARKRKVSPEQRIEIARAGGLARAAKYAEKKAAAERKTG